MQMHSKCAYMTQVTTLRARMRKEGKHRQGIIPTACSRGVARPLSLRRNRPQTLLQPAPPAHHDVAASSRSRLRTCSRRGCLNMLRTRTRPRTRRSNCAMPRVSVSARSPIGSSMHAAASLFLRVVATLASIQALEAPSMDHVTKVPPTSRPHQDKWVPAMSLDTLRKRPRTPWLRSASTMWTHRHPCRRPKAATSTTPRGTSARPATSCRQPTTATSTGPTSQAHCSHNTLMHHTIAVGFRTTNGTRPRHHHTRINRCLDGTFVKVLTAVIPPVTEKEQAFLTLFLGPFFSSLTVLHVLCNRLYTTLLLSHAAPCQ